MKQKLLYVFATVFLLSVDADAQKVITGIVSSAKDNEPLISASVIVEKTTIGTTTDIDGKYSITVPNDAKNLLVSYTGMKTKVVAITGNVINVSLDDNEKVLGDVVVTALGIKREKRALGYSTQEVGGDDLTRSGNPNALSSLSGKVAGVQINTSSGSPGAAVNVRLRGATSLVGDNQPLMVVDGIPINNDQNNSIDNIINGGAYGGIDGDFSQNRGIDINPDDIENISVLKGPAAAALYGSLASNGVILITTKKGKGTGSKKFNIEIGSSIQFDQVNKLPELSSKYVQGSGGEYTPYATRSWGAKGDTMAWDNDVSDALDKHGNLVGQSDPNAKEKFTPYDNMRSFFKTGITTNNNVSVSGGSDKGNFRLSMSNMYQSGIIPLSQLNRATFTFGGSHKVGEIAEISGTASYINSKTDGNLQGNNVSGIMYGVYRTPNSFDNRNAVTNSYTNPKIFIAPDGHQRSYTYYLGRDAYGDNLSIFENPYWSINRNPATTSVDRLIGNVQIHVDPLKCLSFMGRVGADVYSERKKQVYDLESASTPEGQVIEDQSVNRNINSDIWVNFHKDNLFKDFNASLLIGNNVLSQFSQNHYTLGDGLNFQGFYNLSNTQTIISGESKSNRLTTAVYGNLNLDYKSQVYLNVTARNEWSSTLPKIKRSYFYPSVGLSWIFTETAKMAQSNVLPYGKVRFTWAQVGKDASPYSLRQVYNQPIISDQWTNGVSFPYNGLGGFLLSSTLANEKLKPEQTNSYEAGLDLRFLQSMKGFGGFAIDFTYYYMISKNQILNVPVANSSGFAGAIVNSGSIQNQGFEIIASIKPVKIKDFQWDININWSKNMSKVLSLNEGTNNILIGGFDGSSVHAVVGQPYGMLWGGDFIRDNQGNVVVDDRQTLNGDPNAGYGLPLTRTYDSIIGNPNPKWLMGIRNTFTYKGLSLGILFDIKHGGDIYNGTRGALVTYGRAAETENREDKINYGGVKGHIDADGNTVVTGKNDITVDYGAIDPNTGKSIAQLWFSDGNGGGFGKAGKQFVEDGSWFRLREVNLTYSIGRSIIKKGFLQGVDISFIARNLFLVTKYKGIDPDQSLAGSSNIQGVEWFNLPGTRSYGFALKLHF